MLSVVCALAWPRKRDTCTTLRPSAIRREATVCLNVWKPAHEQSASSQAGRSTRECRLSGSTGVPWPLLVNTHASGAVWSW
jgi:hypothetical protein